MLQYHYHMERMFVVPPDAFNPPPKVDSAIVRMIPVDFSRVGAGETAKEPALFARVVTTAFSQRRKMLRSAVRALVDAQGFEKAGIDPQRRGETLSVAEFADLADCALR